MSIEPHFHSLTIQEIRPEAQDAVAVRLALPDELAPAFAYAAGQYLTVRRDFDGMDLRRCYSLCAAPHGGDLWIGVREVEGGHFSGWLNRKAQPGDRIDVMPPDGRFTYIADGKPQHILLVAAGSGITPVIAIAEEALADNPQNTVVLIYANRSTSHIMFKERLDDLKDRHMARVRVFHVLSREFSKVALLAGRIDSEKCEKFFGQGGITPAAGFDSAYLCGPKDMMDLVAAKLAESGLDETVIKREFFLNSDLPPKTGPWLQPIPEGAQVTVILDQRRRTFTFDPAEPSILDAARSLGLDVPFACKAGVCATCRAHLDEGEVVMLRSHGLDQDERDRGYILTCQSRPQSGSIVIDYDCRS